MHQPDSEQVWGKDDLHGTILQSSSSTASIVHEREAIVDEPLCREEVEVKRVPIHRLVDGPMPVRYEGETMIASIATIPKSGTSHDSQRGVHHDSAPISPPHS